MEQTLIHQIYLTGTSTPIETGGYRYEVTLDVPFFHFAMIAISFAVAISIFSLAFYKVWKSLTD